MKYRERHLGIFRYKDVNHHEHVLACVFINSPKSDNLKIRTAYEQQPQGLYIGTGTAKIDNLFHCSGHENGHTTTTVLLHI